ncbi:peptidylprolyl isomerase [Rubeoparvulum massiliense]|uniref:peptidylprolyl isomerase n=1 Tax=Rubeoparvulum massiliense TaxID=1631346 RepID=UPI00065DD0AD|nr:peptidylprolyl isomerase [Rubeoparvulum massiliense]
MSIVKKLGMVLLSSTLLVTLTAGCGNSEKKAEENKTATEQQGNAAGEAQKAPSLAELLPTVEKVSDNPDQVVATYKDKTYTAGEFQSYLHVQAFTYFDLATQINDPSIRKMLLESMVMNQILADSVKEEPKDLQKNVEEQYNNYIQTLTGALGISEEEMMKTLKDKLDITKDQIIEQMRIVALAQEGLKNHVDSLSTNIDKTYADYPELFTKASVRHILIAFNSRSEEDVKKEAEQLVEQIKGGADMAALAQEKSEDPGSKEQGGIYEDAPVFQWVPEFKEAALNMELNEVKAVRTDYGYHVMRVEARTMVPKTEAKEYLAQQSLGGWAYQNMYDNEVTPSLKITME